MTEVLQKTDIHLVIDFSTALEIAYILGAEAVGLDMEGVLGNYVGNEPSSSCFRDFMHGQGAVNMSYALREIQSHPEVAFGIVTNNTNIPNVDAEVGGLVTRVARILGVPLVHKGMQVGSVALRGKPSGDLSKYFCQAVDVLPEHAVLIDDQGVKNTGDAVRAGLKAIIVPNPIGLSRKSQEGVVEHHWVRRARKLEPRIYASLVTQRWLARTVYGCIAKIDPSLIGNLYDHRPS